MTQKPLFLARLVGTQEEMGAQHGRLTADDALRLLAFYKTMPERTLAGDLGTVGKLGVRVVANAWQENLRRTRPKELAARTRAYADAVLAASGGKASPYDRRAALRTLSTMDAMQNCVSLAARAKTGPFAALARSRATQAAIPACSTAIAWGRATADGELLFARNFDFPGVGVWDTAPSFVVCVPDRGQRYGFFATRGADTPVVTVVNEAGLVVAPHTRWHRDVTFSGAMIVDIVHDIARRAETIADAIAIAKEKKSSSSWGIAVGSAREKTAVVLELAGPHLDVVRPAPGAEYLVCNNHYKTETLRAGEFRASAAWDHHSMRRERRLRALVENRSAPLTARDLARFLGDRRDPDAPDRARQLGGILCQPVNVHSVVVSPAQLRAHVGVDRAPACEGQWAELAWTWSGPAGAWELGTSLERSGFSATALPRDFVASHDAATRHVHDAACAYEGSHDVHAARAAIERAVGASPEDPSLRLVAVWLALEAGAPDAAVVHARAGLSLETEAYRRGQLLLWGSRAASRIDPVQARAWNKDLESLAGDGIDELRARGKQHHLGKPRANLMMVDAY